jgi:hypothetical protein
MRKSDDHMDHAWGTQKECHIATHNIQNSKMEQPIAKGSNLEKNSNLKKIQNESICKMRVQEEKLLIYAKIWKWNNYFSLNTMRKKNYTKFDIWSN